MWAIHPGISGKVPDFATRKGVFGDMQAFSCAARAGTFAAGRSLATGRCAWGGGSVSRRMTALRVAVGVRMRADAASVRAARAAGRGARGVWLSGGGRGCGQRRLRADAGFDTFFGLRSGKIGHFSTPLARRPSRARAKPQVRGLGFRDPVPA